jgi:hypothetical protein
MPAATLVVLLKLKSGVDPQEYEGWAREHDAPTALARPSIAEWSLYRSQGLIGADGTGPFDYIEIVQVNDTDQMAEDMAGEAIQRMAAQLGDYADATFVRTHRTV